MEAESAPYLSAGDAAGKRRLLQAGLHLFVTQGLHGTSIRDIGAAAGLTNPALYRHFSSKDALALELFVRCYGVLAGRLEAAAHTPRDELGALFRAYAALIDACPPAVVYVHENLEQFWPRVPAALRRRTVVGQLREVLRRELGPGAAPAPDDLEIRVTAMIGLLAQMARGVLRGGLHAPARRWAEPAARAVRGMLRP